MAAFVPFHNFSLALAEGVHDLSANQLKVALVAAATPPDAALDSVLVDITEIAYANLLNDPVSREITTTSSAQTLGDYKLVLADLTLEASGGAVAAFRYVVVYNDTAAADNLLGYYDYGSDQVLADGETMLIDFDGVNGALQFNWV